MLIPGLELVKYWGVNPKDVLHVGAHTAEELGTYENLRWGKIIWVESQPDKVQFLLEKMKNSPHEVIEAAVWDIPNLQIEMKVMTNSASSSLLDLGTHKAAHPEIKLSHTFTVTTRLLSDIVPKEFNPELLVLDIQGAELRALKGFETRLEGIKWIYTEVNRDYLYEKCCLVSELDEYLENFGFKRLVTRWTRHGWGDAVYAKKEVTPRVLSYKKLVWATLNLKYELFIFLSRVKYKLYTHLIKN